MGGIQRRREVQAFSFDEDDTAGGVTRTPVSFRTMELLLASRALPYTASATGDPARVQIVPLRPAAIHFSIAFSSSDSSTIGFVM